MDGNIRVGELLTYNLTELIKPESYLVRLTPITRFGEGDATERIITYSRTYDAVACSGRHEQRSFSLVPRVRPTVFCSFTAPVNPHLSKYRLGSAPTGPPALCQRWFCSRIGAVCFRGVPVWLRGRGAVFVLSGQKRRVRLDAAQRRHTRHQIHAEHRAELRPRRLQAG